MTDRKEDTQPGASQEPISEPGAAHAREFARLVGVLLQDKLGPIYAHIEREESDKDKVFLALRNLEGDMKFIRIELKSTRAEQAAIGSKVDALSERAAIFEERIRKLEENEGRLQTLERKVG